jgi:hypothetical protein
MAAGCPTGPGSSGGIDWQPDLTHPVFYGMQDLKTADGPPQDMVIWYPTTEGTPAGAPILEPCLSQWPVVLFLHGDPPAGVQNEGYHRAWQLLPAQLARCGYVTVVPNYQADLLPSDDLVNQALANLTWVRTRWEYAKWIHSRMESTAVAGHSFGALLAARIAKIHANLAALVSLSGGYRNLPPELNATQVDPPSMFMWAVGGQDVTLLGEEDLDLEALWYNLTQSRYAATFRGEHFDYLPAAATGSNERGPCAKIDVLAAALTTIFVAQNLPTTFSTAQVGFDLRVPATTLTPSQQTYASGNLAGIDAFNATAGCHLDLRWDYKGLRGSRQLGPN